ncbi:MAG: D-alanyl-D-alanine carboxypeptidase family protein [Candidatus Levyibacteriota bacterium]
MTSSQSEIWKKKRLKKLKKKRAAAISVKEAPSKKVENIPVKEQKIDATKSHSSPKKKISLQHTIRKIKESVTKKHEKKTTPKREYKALHHLKRHDSDLQLILFPLILLVILFTLMVFNNQLVSSVSSQSFLPPQITTPLHPYPYIKAVKNPEISAKTAIILDRDSQVILYSKNPQLRFSMASTTKIMTALTALDYFGLQDILTVKRSYVPGSGLQLVQGEKFRFLDLLYAMMLPSANDAAQTIADNYPGGNDAFVAKMNEKAQSLHLTNTHYVDPDGLGDDGDYTTVIDMARLASYATTNKVFAKVTSTKYYTINALNFARQYPLTNLNELLGIDGVNGIKTGTTEGAGEVLVTSTVKNDHTYIIVVMDSIGRFSDTSMLLHFIDNNVQYMIPSGQ